MKNNARSLVHRHKDVLRIENALKPERILEDF
jgi:hypothetical protein